MSQQTTLFPTRTNWVLIASLVFATLSSLLIPARPALAAPFTPGNIVVYRVGDGIGALVNTGNPVFLDEYTPAGVLVQTIAMPTAPSGGNNPLVASGIAGSEGGLNLTTDGNFLVLAGYNAQLPNATSLAGSDAATVNRVIGRVDGLGNINTTTSLNNYAAFDNPREVASDNGTRFWGVSGDGSATDPPGLGGVFYATLGATSGTQIAAGPPTNVRSINIFGGQLYASSQQTSGVGRGILRVGTGLPTTAGQTMTLIPGHGTSAASPTMRDFVMLDLNPSVAGVDTIYSANEYNGLRKYSFNGTTWLTNGVIHPRAASTNVPSVGDQVYRRITAVANGNEVTLYATRYQVLTIVFDPVEQEDVIETETNGELVKLVDTTGHNVALAGTPSVIIPASANIAVRGVAMAPTPPAMPDLSVSVAGPATSIVGTQYNYTLTVNNSGTANASNISVTFAMPAGASFVSASGTNGFTGSASSGTVTFSGGSINAGSSATLTVTVNTSATGTVTVPIGAAVADPANTVSESNEANNASTAAVNTNVTTPMPDLTVSVAGPANGVVGTSYDYTLTVTNAGTASATAIGVQFTLPAGLTFVSAVDTGATGFTGAEAAGVVTFTGGSIAIGGNAVLSVTVTPTSVGAVTVPVGAAVVDQGGTIVESNEANNTSTAAVSTNVTPIPQPDLTVGVTGPAAGAVGSNYSYTLTVANQGTANATNINVQLTLPAGLTFVSATDTGATGFTGAEAAGVVTFTGGSIAAGGSAVLNVTVTPTATGNVSLPAGAAVVDLADTVDESNETNNASTGAVNTLITPPDTIAPDTTITAQPALETISASASLSFTGTDNLTPANAVTFECSLDGAAFALCSSPANYSGLALGSHTFQVRARDAAGNVDASPATAVWTVVEDEGEQWMIYLPLVAR